MTIKTLIERLQTAALPGTNRHKLDCEAIARIQWLELELIGCAQQMATAGEQLRAHAENISRAMQK